MIFGKGDSVTLFKLIKRKCIGARVKPNVI